MATSIVNAKITAFASEIPAVASRTASLKAIYEEHQNRIYNLAFYMTDNEMTAESLSAQVFSNVFAVNLTPSAEVLDRALVNELRESMAIGQVTLNIPVTTEISNARRNIKRAILERAVMQVPATERLIFLMHDVEDYDFSRIARTLGLSTDECCNGLHQARLAVRQAVSQIKF